MATDSEEKQPVNSLSINSASSSNTLSVTDEEGLADLQLRHDSSTVEDTEIDLTETVVCPHCNTPNDIERSLLGVEPEVDIFDGPNCNECGYPLGESMDGS